jgi:membrane fusion protein, multidrug efflux system
MRIVRLLAYVVCAAMVGGAGYFFWLAPGGSPVSPGAGQAASKGQGAGKSKSRAVAAPVTAATVALVDMPVIIAAPGTVEPLANVAVKTRTDGQIIEVLFKEGDAVLEGDVLFRLDDRLVKAQIAQAQASISKDQASLRDAEATLARREALIGKQIVTEASLDQSRFAVEGLKASIAAGQALLESQKTQLDYLTIRAPITGRTGSLNAKIGATVRGIDALPLVTINQTKPILVSFAVPQIELPALRRALQSKASAEIFVPGAGRQAVRGSISFIDNQVDKQTGNITIKVVAENADEALWPGLSVEVALTVEVKSNMLSAPASAVLPAQQGMIAWVIGSDNKVAPRVVTVDRIVGQTVFLSSGLAAGDRVVTDGQLRLAPGTAVTVDEHRRPPAAKPLGEERRASGRG